MPYIITTAYPPIIGETGAFSECDPRSTRRAVATPDEARDYVHSLRADYGAMAHLDCVLDGTSRMPIGPLPDGTIIEVAPISSVELWRETGAVSLPVPGDMTTILDAYNAQVTA